MKGAEVFPEMAPATAPYFAWEPPDHSLRVLLKLSLVDLFKSWLAEPSNAEKEVGGILLGSVEQNEGMTPVVRIDGYAPVRIGHDRGPTYTLTEKEKNQFGDEITSAQRRTGRTAVGLVRSHIRRGLYLDIADAALFRRYFPGPSAVYLLLRDGPETVGGFFWEAGDLQKQAPYARFVLDRQKLEGSTEALPVERKTEAPVLKVQLAARPRVAAGGRSAHTSRARWNWLAAAAGSIALLAGIAYELPRSRVSAKPGRLALGLSVAHQSERLRLTWNVSSPLVEQASGGTLWIDDGQNHRQKELNRSELLTGAALYTPLSDDVNFALEVHSGPLSSRESIRSIGVRQTAKAAAPVNPAVPRPEPGQVIAGAAPGAARPPEPQSADRIAAPPDRGSEKTSAQTQPVRESKPAPAVSPPVLAATRRSTDESGRVPQVAKASEKTAAQTQPARESKPSPAAPPPVVAATPRSTAESVRVPQVAAAGEKTSAQTQPASVSNPSPAVPPPLAATAPPADESARVPQATELKLVQSAVALPPPALHGLKADVSAVRAPPPAPVFEFVGYEVTPESGLLKKMRGSESGDSSDFVAPKATHEVRPDVPKFVADTLSGDQRIQLRAAIDHTGTVTDVEPLNSGANAWLTGASNTALRRWTFAPAKSKGRAVSCRVVITFHFSRSAHSSNAAANPAASRGTSEN